MFTINTKNKEHGYINNLYWGYMAEAIKQLLCLSWYDDIFIWKWPVVSADVITDHIRCSHIHIIHNLLVR